jgi:hypothetical protein
MWAIDNRTSFKVERAWGRNAQGAHEWIVAVKGTFDIRADGQLVPAEEQLDALLAGEYHGEPGQSSLRYDADVVAAKPTTDLLLNGTAYAPERRPSTDFMIGMAVGPLRKVLRVRGNRRRGDGVFASGCEPVTEVPIVYERAYGGHDLGGVDVRRHRLDSRNPVGVGIGAKGSLQDTLLPNFEYPDGNVEKAGPAGFGAIDSHWTPRLELQGTYDAAWQAGRAPLLPNDWDARSLLCAPRDQLPPTHLLGGERVELANLTPSGSLSFQLPRIFFRFQTRIDGRIVEHRGQLASVVIEPDHRRVLMVWQSSLAVRTNGDYLERTVVSEKVQLT